jgi:hypothetical protein
MTKDISFDRIIAIITDSVYWISIEWPCGSLTNTQRIKEVIVDNIKAKLEIDHIPPSLEMIIMSITESVFRRIKTVKREEMKESLRNLLTDSAQ